MVMYRSKDLTAAQNAPSKPYLTDTHNATDPNLWEKVLMVARGDLRYMTRVGPKGPRTIHAPNHGLGYRHWPNMRAVAWAVKQYNGYGGRWKSKDEGKEVTASAEGYSGWMGFRVPRGTSRVLSQIDVPGLREDEGSLHTTLIYMGQDTSLESFCRAVEVAFGVISTAAPFTLKTNKVISFPEGDDGVPIVCKVESDPLHEFRGKMTAALDETGVEYNKKYPVYKPHVCLSYADETLPDLEIPTIEWGAHELELWLGHNGTLASVNIPIHLVKGRIAIGNGCTSARLSLQNGLSVFRTMWRFKTRDHG
jgi:2'-5' RNA ligase